MKKPLTKSTKKLGLLQKIVLFIAALLLVLLAWNWYTRYTDKQKFMTLKQDMLSLQAEFNKVDSGWAYSESCNSKGEKFKENEASSCGISLSNKVSTISKYQKILSEGDIYIEQDTSYKDKEGVFHDNRMVRFVGNKKMNCELTSSFDDDKYSNAWLSCSGSALDFYFPRAQ